MEEKLLKTASCDENSVKVTCKVQDISPCLDAFVGKQHSLYTVSAISNITDICSEATSRLCPL